MDEECSLVNVDVCLRDRSMMPLLGLGTFHLNGDNCCEVISAGLQMGYRLIDTARCYRLSRNWN